MENLQLAREIIEVLTFIYGAEEVPTQWAILKSKMTIIQMHEHCEKLISF